MTNTYSQMFSERQYVCVPAAQTKFSFNRMIFKLPHVSHGYIMCICWPNLSLFVLVKVRFILIKWAQRANYQQNKTTFDRIRIELDREETTKCTNHTVLTTSIPYYNNNL